MLPVANKSLRPSYEIIFLEDSLKVVRLSHVAARDMHTTLKMCGHITFRYVDSTRLVSYIKWKECPLSRNAKSN